MKVSIKSEFKDTIFYEHRYGDKIKYSYSLLSEKQNDELQNLISSLGSERSVPKFKFSNETQILIVDFGQVKFYKHDFLEYAPRSTYKKIYYFLKEIRSQDTIKLDEIKNFWNIGDISEPPSIYDE